MRLVGTQWLLFNRVNSLSDADVRIAVVLGQAVLSKAAVSLPRGEYDPERIAFCRLGLWNGKQGRTEQFHPIFGVKRV
jgi:hypothetical protein